MLTYRIIQVIYIILLQVENLYTFFCRLNVIIYEFFGNYFEITPTRETNYSRPFDRKIRSAIEIKNISESASKEYSHKSINKTQQLYDKTIIYAEQHNKASQEGFHYNEQLNSVRQADNDNHKREQFVVKFPRKHRKLDCTSGCSIISINTLGDKREMFEFVNCDIDIRSVLENTNSQINLDESISNCRSSSKCEDFLMIRNYVRSHKFRKCIIYVCHNSLKLCRNVLNSNYSSQFEQTKGINLGVIENILNNIPIRLVQNELSLGKHENVISNSPIELLKCIINSSSLISKNGREKSVSRDKKFIYHCKAMRTKLISDHFAQIYTISPIENNTSSRTNFSDNEIRKQSDKCSSDKKRITRTADYRAALNLERHQQASKTAGSTVSVSTKKEQRKKHSFESTISEDSDVKEQSSDDKTFDSTDDGQSATSREASPLHRGAWSFHLVNIALHAAVTHAFVILLTHAHVNR